MLSGIADLGENVLSKLQNSLRGERPNALAENLSEHFRTARHVFLVAAPFGMIVGASIAGYDYLVNEVMWKSLNIHLSPFLLCFMPIVRSMLFEAFASP